MSRFETQGPLVVRHHAIAVAVRPGPASPRPTAAGSGMPRRPHHAVSPIPLTVNTLADDPTGVPISGYTTLRDAINQADADTANQYVINFASGLQGTMDLTSSLPDLSNNIYLQGPGALDLTVQRLSSAPDFSVFTVDSGATVNLSGMTISGGDAFDGGGLDNFGTLTVSNSFFFSNSATYGGGLANELGGTLTVSNSFFYSNSALYGGGGGGIFNSGTATVTGSTFTSNYGGDGGGGIFNSGTATVTGNSFTGNSVSVDFAGGGICGIDGGVIVTNSTFTGNSASEGGGIYDTSRRSRQLFDVKHCQNNC